ncbi:helix-turn-helix domain-containing protein [Patescibacteria group bacterium]|nr:helix-turn-helix domain-containing protein [Patescibacteria group bacterium]
MKKPIEDRQTVVLLFLAGEIDKQKAASLLNCTMRTIENYRKQYKEKGLDGLKDHRHSNYHKLTHNQKEQLIQLKKNDRWRSARNIRDHLKLLVSEQHVERILVSQGLNRENLKRVKAITRFEAKYPNELWQTDIMGKIFFPNIGILYLIATLDDHSRFVPEGRWFRTQGKMNVFQIWYESLSKCGLPDAMLQDAGSQYKAKARFGTADYEWYAKQLEIGLKWAHKAETKGKIERFWKFVQGDFVPEVIDAKTPEDVNGAFKVWLARYNYVFKSRYFGNVTRASRYKPSERRLSQIELQTLLTVEERRKVTRESTISLYGKHYLVPPGYIGCRIWIKIKGNKLYFEAGGKVFWKTRLRE